MRALMEHGVELTAVLIVCVALTVGAVARLARKWLRLPYTILLLLAGAGVGLVLESSASAPDLWGRLEQGAHVSPDLIIFAFLPALVFESAYNLDGYAFRRNIGAVVLLAVPALLVATVAVGGAMVFLSAAVGWDWSWPAALVFGALIAATDPVAVVALLRELGAPRRLTVLIEGESLLNDGTAIVVFGSLVGGVVAGGFEDASVGRSAAEFAVVVAGGVAVGAVLTGLVSLCLARTFNDSSVEIILTIVLAYACMVVAEAALHVSGVIALVTAGLLLGGPARTTISPEVQKFLHKFWAMVAFIANTLIFFVVGLVVGGQLRDSSATDAVLIAGAYGAVVLLRFAVTLGFRPLLGRVGAPVSRAEATAMAWGGLRGAVSLALALMFAQDARIPQELREQILLVTAGVVALTIVVNGSLAGWLFDKLGFAETPPASRKLELAAIDDALDEVEKQVDEIALSRQLPSVRWNEVEADLRERRAAIDREFTAVNERLAGAGEREQASGFWQRVLYVERQAYWRRFDAGTLGARTVRVLDREIEHQLDEARRGRSDPPPRRHPRVSIPRPWFRVGRRARLTALEFDRLAMVYDLARAEHEAAGDVLDWLREIDVEPEVAREVRRVYRGYLRAGKERLEDMRNNLPEVVQAIETRLARRIQLNLEREQFERQARRGALNGDAAAAELERIEADMKRLRRRPRHVLLPETAIICRNTPLFRALPDALVNELAEITKERVVVPGDALFEEGDDASSMFVVVRGIAELHTKAEDGPVATFSTGDIFGERALITGEPRAGTVVARSTLTVGEIDRDDFERLLSEHPELRERLLAVFERYAPAHYQRGIQK